MYMPDVWHPGQGFWDTSKFFHEPQRPQNMKLVPGTGEPLRVFELRRWQTWSYTVGRWLCSSVALTVQHRGLWQPGP